MFILLFSGMVFLIFSEDVFLFCEASLRRAVPAGVSVVLARQAADHPRCGRGVGATRLSVWGHAEIVAGLRADHQRKCRTRLK